MQIRVIKHIRKVYGCRGRENAPVTADKPAQLIEKSMARACPRDAADHQVCRRSSVTSPRDGAESARRGYPASDADALGYPMRRT